MVIEMRRVVACGVVDKRIFRGNDRVHILIGVLVTWE